MATFLDAEFGEIHVRRSFKTRSIRIRMTPDGSLRASMPSYAPMIVLKQFINSSRDQLRSMLQQSPPAYELSHGTQIGKSHRLHIIQANRTSVKRYKQQITVTLAPTDTVHDTAVVQLIRDEIKAALRVEAKSYLPKRLKYLAEQLDCRYERVRFSHASSRWGSCSSTGTISLNIALMKLPFELIDYVIIHELSHTKQMNHSARFWKLVEDADPSYKLHRKQLKSHSPTI